MIVGISPMSMALLQRARSAGGLAPGTVLLTFSEAEFTRDTEASYLTAADTLAWAAADTLRSEDRGDGNGAAYVFEGRRLTFVSQNQVLSAAPWGAPTFGTITPDAAIAPDGNTIAEELAWTTATGNANLSQTLAAGLDTSGEMTATWWVKALSGTGLFRIWCVDETGVDRQSADLTTTTTWQRFSFTFTGAAGGGSFPFRLRNASDAALRTQHVIWPELIKRPYPLSTMRNNTSSTMTHGEDVLQFLAAQVPEHLLASATRWPVYPSYASTELRSGWERWIFSNGGTAEGLRLRYNGTDMRAERLLGGSVASQSGALTFGRHAELLVDADPVSGIVTVNGVPGPAGTTGPWTTGNAVRVGGVVGDTGSADPAVSTEFDGRIKEPTAL